MIDAYLKDAPSFADVLPTRTADGTLMLTRGGRVIEILHLGRGHTAADLVVHLPREGMVATGDLVVFPIPLVGGDQSFVSEWSGTLEKVLALNPKIIVPGHGPVMRDTSYMRMMIDLSRRSRRRSAPHLRQGRRWRKFARPWIWPPCARFLLVTHS